MLDSDLQQGALAGAVAPDDANHFTFSHLEGDVAQPPRSPRGPPYRRVDCP